MERAVVQERFKGVYLRAPDLVAREIRVHDLSELGLGVEAGAVPQVPPEGKTFKAQLSVGNTSVMVDLRMVHVTAGIVGLVFISPTELVRGAIRAYFEPELIGAAMRPVGQGPRRIKGHDWIRVYQDQRSNSLTLTWNDERLRRFSLRFLGGQVDWAEGEAMTFRQNGKSHEISEHLKSQILKLIRNLETLEPDERKTFESVLAMAA